MRAIKTAKAVEAAEAEVTAAVPAIVAPPTPPRVFTSLMAKTITDFMAAR